MSKRTLMQETAILHPCLLAEETAHPRFGLGTRHGSIVLSVNVGYE